MRPLVSNFLARSSTTLSSPLEERPAEAELKHLADETALYARTLAENAGELGCAREGLRRSVELRLAVASQHVAELVLGSEAPGQIVRLERLVRGDRRPSGMPCRWAMRHAKRTDLDR